MPDDLPHGLGIEPVAAEGSDVDALIVDVDGFEGPLDVLLALARLQKVDLRRVSILQLAEHYLAFVARSQDLRIELAADYLVMAAWLAWLKSRLLLPPPPGEEGPSGEDMAAHLAFQLQRLEAMRRAAVRLMARDQLGRDFFQRGAPETVVSARRTEWQASLSDLLRAYARIRTRDDYRPLQIDRPAIYAIETALARLAERLGGLEDWAMLVSFLPAEMRRDRARVRSALASTLAAALELAKRGDLDLSQDSLYAPIQLRRKVVEE